jgi:uncharacterized protein (TIGR02246 family)
MMDGARGVVMIVALAMLAACNGGSNSQSGGPAQAAAAADTPDPRIAEEAVIRGVDVEWLKALDAKDATGAVSYYADNAKVYVPGLRLADGKDAITRSMSGLMSMPGFALKFTPDTVMVARSGDMAYETGEYEMTMDDKSGKPETTKAQYVVVWVKQPDGAWKAVIDAPTTTQ